MTAVQSFDGAILGAGLAGRLAAWQLVRSGARVALVERAGPDGAGSAAYVAAAMLAPLAESAIAESRIVDPGRARAAGPLRAGPAAGRRRPARQPWRAARAAVVRGQRRRALRLGGRRGRC